MTKNLLFGKRRNEKNVNIVLPLNKVPAPDTDLDTLYFAGFFVFIRLPRFVNKKLIPDIAGV